MRAIVRTRCNPLLLQRAPIGYWRAMAVVAVRTTQPDERFPCSHYSHAPIVLVWLDTSSSGAAAISLHAPLHAPLHAHVSPIGDVVSPGGARLKPFGAGCVLAARDVQAGGVRCKVLRGCLEQEQSRGVPICSGRRGAQEGRSHLLKVVGLLRRRCRHGAAVAWVYNQLALMKPIVEDDHCPPPTLKPARRSKVRVAPIGQRLEAHEQVSRRNGCVASVCVHGCLLRPVCREHRHEPVPHELNPTHSGWQEEVHVQHGECRPSSRHGLRTHNRTVRGACAKRAHGRKHTEGMKLIVRRCDPVACMARCVRTWEE